jgi:hypothetical protein
LVFFSLIRTFAAMFEELKEKYRRFKEWQQKPYQVKPLSEDKHVCTTCGTQYEGNYCPRCGQSSKIGRYSFKNAFLLFLDVWGLGNRGMFRTIRDLILRPGYMIRDYLQGMQMAYFPPFKLFFLLIALSLLVESGLNVKGVNRFEESMEMFDKIEQENTQQVDEVGKQVTSDFLKQTREATIWINNHMTIVLLVLLLLFSGPLYLFFRHCPNLPDMRFSEFFVAIIYFTDMWNIYSIIVAFLGISLYYESFIPILAIIPLKQLSGYSYWRTIWKTFLALVIFGGAFYAILIGNYAFMFATSIQ